MGFRDRGVFVPLTAGCREGVLFRWGKSQTLILTAASGIGVLHSSQHPAFAMVPQALFGLAPHEVERDHTGLTFAEAETVDMNPGASDNLARTCQRKARAFQPQPSLPLP